MNINRDCYPGTTPTLRGSDGPPCVLKSNLIIDPAFSGFFLPFHRIGPSFSHLFILLSFINVFSFSHLLDIFCCFPLFYWNCRPCLLSFLPCSIHCCHVIFVRSTVFELSYPFGRDAPYWAYRVPQPPPLKLGKGGGCVLTPPFAPNFWGRNFLKEVTGMV